MSNAYRAVVQSGGGAVGDATAADVLTGKTFSGAVGSGVTGTMPNNGAVAQTLAAGQSYTVPAGYHNGSGTVTAAAAIIPTNKGVYVGNDSTFAEVDISGGSLTTPNAYNAYVLNVTAYDTLGCSEPAKVHKIGGMNTSGTITMLTAASSVDISAYDYLLLYNSAATTVTFS